MKGQPERVLKVNGGGRRSRTRGGGVAGVDFKGKWRVLEWVLKVIGDGRSSRTRGRGNGGVTGMDFKDKLRGWRSRTQGGMGGVAGVDFKGKWRWPAS